MKLRQEKTGLTWLIKTALALVALATLPPTSKAQFKASSFDTPSYVELESAAFTISEERGVLQVTLNRTGDFRRTTTVNFALVEGTASANDDFQNAGGTIVFAPGVGTKTISLTVHHDDLAEADEHFYLQLTTSDPNAVLLRDQAAITLHDSPKPHALPRLQIAPGANGMILLSWDASGPDCVLERTRNSETEPWTEVAAEPELVDKRLVVRETISNPAYFYRLRLK